MAEAITSSAVVRCADYRLAGFEKNTWIAAYGLINCMLLRCIQPDQVARCIFIDVLELSTSWLYERLKGMKECFT
jgi:hypothetical protein